MSSTFDWVVLVNPLAGKRSVALERVEAALGRNRVPAPIEVVHGRQAMREAVVEVARAGRHPAVVGGDGTVALSVGALVEAGLAEMPALGILPGGTGCDLLRTFGIPQEIDAAAAHLATPSTYRIDVGVLTGSWGTSHFVNVAQAGAGGAAAETAHRLSRRWGRARYPLAFAARLPRFPPTEITITGRRQYSSPALAVILANAQFFAGGWNVAPRAMLVDGELDVQVINAKKRQAVTLVPQLIKGVHLSRPEVRRRSMAELTVTTDVPWPVEADGDYLGSTPFEARVLPGSALIKI